MKTILTLLCICWIQLTSASNQLKLTMSGNGYNDEIAVVFDTNGTAAYNSNLDAWKLFSPVTAIGQLYTMCGPSEKLAIYALPLDVLQDTIIDLYALVDQAGSYLITPTEMTPFGNGESILLEDISSGMMYDLRKGLSYTFNLPVLGSNSPAPFRIHFRNTNSIATGIRNRLIDADVKCKILGDEINVSLDDGQVFDANISALDMEGRELKMIHGTGQTSYVLFLEGLATEAIIIRVVTGNNLWSRKVMKISTN